MLIVYKDFHHVMQCIVSSSAVLMPLCKRAAAPMYIWQSCVMQCMHVEEAASFSDCVECRLFCDNVTLVSAF